MPRRNHRIKIRAQYAIKLREDERSRKRQRIANRKRDQKKVSYA